MATEKTNSKIEGKIEELNTFWAETTRENIERMASVYDQFAKLEKKSVVQLSNNVDEMGKLMKASIDFMTEMNDQWRTLTVDTFRKAQR